jgi:hypothetical protein
MIMTTEQTAVFLRRSQAELKMKRTFLFFVCVVLVLSLSGCGSSKDDAEKFLSKNPDAQLLPCAEVHRELREKKRTKRDQLEMTLVPISEAGLTDASLTYTLMRAAIDEQKRNLWYVVVVNIRACDGSTDECPMLGRAVYIPDGKGYDGKSSSEKWSQLGVFIDSLREVGVDNG